MIKRRLICWSLILLILAAFAVWLEPTRVVWGWLRGEAFYQGRPTSWWRQELTHWKMHEVWQRSSLEWCASQRHLEIVFERSPTRFEELVSWLRVKVFRAQDAKTLSIPPVLNHDCAAKAVLAELADDSSPEVRAFANLGLERVRAAQALMDSTRDEANSSP